MIDLEWAKAFAEEWIDSWNLHDLERILLHYTPDFEMSSPLIVKRKINPEGKLVGKVNVRPYWQIGLNADPPLKFTLLNVFAGIDNISILYERNEGKIATEVLFFNDELKVVKGCAMYSEL